MKKQKPKRTQIRDRIIVALDTPDLKRVKRLVKSLHRLICHFKIGSELYTACGPEAVKAVRWLGGHVFLDLKYHDIPNTVAGAVRAAVKMNVFMLSVHMGGGLHMLEAARRAVDDASRYKSAKRRPKLIGVTILTSMGESEMQREIGIEKSLDKTVLRFAKMADRIGLDGVVASAQELPVIRSHVSKDLAVVTPGIRPAWSFSRDQRRIMTPGQAMSLGADYLVIGRPITAAKDPRQAAEKIIQSIVSPE